MIKKIFLTAFIFTVQILNASAPSPAKKLIAKCEMFEFDEDLKITIFFEATRTNTKYNPPLVAADNQVSLSRVLGIIESSPPIKLETVIKSKSGFKRVNGTIQYETSINKLEKFDTNLEKQFAELKEAVLQKAKEKEAPWALRMFDIYEGNHVEEIALDKDGNPLGK